MSSADGLFANMSDNDEDIDGPSESGFFTPTNEAQRAFFPPYAYDQNMSDPSLNHCTPPSRPRSNAFFRCQSFSPHPYGREMSFRSTQPPLNNDQVTSLMESQKAIMKTQESVVNMLKDVVKRVENLENTTTVNPDEQDTKKIPPELSVSG